MNNIKVNKHIINNANAIIIIIISNNNNNNILTTTTVTATATTAIRSRSISRLGEVLALSPATKSRRRL
jgi:hypothetical protein